MAIDRYLVIRAIVDKIPSSERLHVPSRLQLVSTFLTMPMSSVVVTECTHDS